MTQLQLILTMPPAISFIPLAEELMLPPLIVIDAPLTLWELSAPDSIVPPVTLISGDLISIEPGRIVTLEAPTISLMLVVAVI